MEGGLAAVSFYGSVGPTPKIQAEGRISLVVPTHRTNVAKVTRAKSLLVDYTDCTFVEVMH